jgi:MSHA biogenesis protein MshN
VLRQGIRLAPGNLTLRTRCAKLLISQQHHRRALEALRLDNPPNVQDHVPYYALLAYTLRKLGESERSARIYRALAEHEPDRGKWWMGLGLCLERLDRNRPALSAYERALAAGLPEDIHAFITQRREVLASGQPE